MEQQVVENGRNLFAKDFDPGGATLLSEDFDPDVVLLQQLLLSQEHQLPESRRERRRMRELFLDPEYQRIRQLEDQVLDLQAQLRNKDALIAMLTPAISEAISQRVIEARDEVAEALYPVIGRTIQRAVSESMRDLARRIDFGMRQSLGFTLFRRLGLWLRGVKPEEAAMRSSLPFEVHEILLIHRETGLLIQHLSTMDTLSDADLISGMLTAIRSYVQDSFDPSTDQSLDAIEYGDVNILIEEDQVIVLAVVLQGIQPAGFRGLIRQQLTEVRAACGGLLRQYNGDPIDEAIIIPTLQPLMEVSHAAT